METLSVPGSKELRIFGLTMAAAVAFVFGVVVPWVGGHAIPVWPWPAAVILALAALAAPPALEPIYAAWMRVGHTLNWVISRVTLVFVYYFVVTPMAAVMRLGGKDPMKRRFDRDSRTYRVPSRALDRKHFERPY